VSLTDEVYGPSTVKRRRRTNGQLADVDAAIVAAVEIENPVTLRGVFYRVVSAGAVEKSENGYRLVGRQLLKLRRAGVVPYSYIADGTRWINKPETWNHIDQMLEDAAKSYRRALWHDQAYEVQVYSEKDAITGVVLPATSKWDVPLGVTRGYSSESYAWSVAESIRYAFTQEKQVFIYDLGDHDPSGVDAWRAFTQRVKELVYDAGDIRRDGYRWPISQHYGCLHFERLAVTEQQITDMSLPTRPTKGTDSRAAGFQGGSVEVDAIPPTVLRRLVEDAITRHIDPEKLRLNQLAEQSEREILRRMKGVGQ
jgi:hypothetical protein